MYVQSLASQLQTAGIQVLVAAPGKQNEAYLHAGLEVRRFAINDKISDLRALYGAGDPIAAEHFGRMLDDEQPDLVHLHAFTRGASLLVVREARKRGLPVVFTYHTPTVSCQRGTLLRWGTEICDGRLDVQTCTQCTLHGLGMNRPASLLLGSLPPQVGRTIGRTGRSGGIWTALRMSELVEARQDACRSLLSEVDHIVVLCRWTRDLLLRNGVPASKMTISPHGLALADDNDQLPQSIIPSSPLRIVFLGRLDPTKGPDILIKALRHIPALPVELHLYGIAQGNASDAYLRQLQTLADTDPRITFLPAVPGDQVIPILKTYHTLAVPSRWLETGPLVVLEAFAAGIPVLGSQLGGIAELVTHERDGLLVAPDSVNDWVVALTRIVDQPDLYAQLKDGVRPPRRIEQVSNEMLELYARMLSKQYALVPPVEVTLI